MQSDDNVNNLMFRVPAVKSASLHLLGEFLQNYQVLYTIVLLNLFTMVHIVTSIMDCVEKFLGCPNTGVTVMGTTSRRSCQLGAVESQVLYSQ